MAKNVIRKTNLREFFRFEVIGSNNIKPGMLCAFMYSSPDGIHDPYPLIYVLSKEKDRVWGLNINYQFTLMAQMYNAKQIEVNQSKKEIKPTTQTPNPNANQDVLTKVPKLKNVLSKTRTKPSLSKPKPKQQITQSAQKFNIKANLDLFALQQKPDFILRNYLFLRMKTVRKLIYKV